MKKILTLSFLTLLVSGVLIAQTNFKVNKVLLSKDSLRTSKNYIDTITEAGIYRVDIIIEANQIVNVNHTLKFVYSTNGSLSTDTLISPNNDPGRSYMPANTADTLHFKAKVNLTGSSDITLCIKKVYWCCYLGTTEFGDVDPSDDIACKSVIFKKDPPVGLPQTTNIEFSKIQVAQNQLSVEIRSTSEHHYKLEVFDLTGRGVLSETWSAEGNQTRNFDFYRPAGYYIARLLANGEVLHNQKIFVK